MDIETAKSALSILRQIDTVKRELEEMRKIEDKSLYLKAKDNYHDIYVPIDVSNAVYKLVYTSHKSKLDDLENELKKL